METATLRFDRVSKEYRLGQIGYRSLREDIADFFRGRERGPGGKFLALDKVSFSLSAGEAVGIIGPNGAGKSTILKLLSNVTAPSSGSVSAGGKIGSLIELSAGFHPELTGRENVYLYGSILGMSNKEVAGRFDEIVSFSGLAPFIDTPVKRYSSGMYARLGFSVSAHLDPDILLVDEVLSVGDFTFQDRCIDKMLAFRKSRKTIVYVSHNLDSVRKLCNRAILLEAGRVAYDGDVEEAINRYYEHFSKGQQGRHAQVSRVRLLGKELTGPDGSPCTVVASNTKVRLRLDIRPDCGLSDAYVAVFLRHSTGQVVYDTSSDLLTGSRTSFERGRDARVTVELSLSLLKGTYTIGCNIHGSVEGAEPGCVFYDNSLFTVTIKEEVSHQGIANLNAGFEIEAAR